MTFILFWKLVCLYRNARGRKTICLAGNDTASQFKDLRSAFEALGLRVITFVHSRPESPIVSEDDYDLVGQRFQINISRVRSKLRTLTYFSQIIDTYDRYILALILFSLSRFCNIFVFMSCSFSVLNRDLGYIRKWGRSIVYIFTGDDARWYYGMLQDFKLHGLSVYSYGVNYDYSVCGLEQRLRRIRTVEQCADLIFSKREQSQLQIRGFYHFPMCVDVTQFIPEPSQRQVPLILHCPSNKDIKGTSYVLEAVRLLEQELQFEFRLVENMPHAELQNLIRAADIVIDQLHIPGGGRLATEAMAYGKVVLSRMAYGVYGQGFPVADCPIVDVGPETLVYAMRQIVPDLALRRQLAERGPTYVRAHLDVRSFAKKIIDLLENPNQVCDYYPDFYPKRYKAESPEAEACLKKWDAQ